MCCFPSFAPLSVWYFLWLPASAVQQDAVVGRQAQAGTRAGNHQRHTHRRETSAHQRRQTTPHNGKHLNTPTRATNGSPPTRALHMHQTRTSRMHQSTKHATKVAPIDTVARQLFSRVLQPLPPTPNTHSLLQKTQ